MSPLRARLERVDTLELPRGTMVGDAWLGVARSCCVTDDELAAHVATAYGLAVADPDTAEPAALKLVPASLAHKHHVFPIRQDDDRLIVATSDPTDMPVVILTGSEDAHTEIELMTKGADDYIRKPIDPPRFIARITAALRRAKG